jgi:16S rRNA (guanine527-N7)-methyltransferase
MSDAKPPPREFAGLPAGFMDAVGATAERLETVEAYRQRLVRANAGMNLVGASTLDVFWERHFLDSAQLLWFAPGARVWADLGAGAGLPGLVLASLLKGVAGARVHLVESVAKRCAFLVDTIAALDLPAELHHARAESLSLKVDVVAARACAPLTRLLGYARPHLRGATRGMFLKGSGADAEIAEARRAWRFKVHAHQSLSDPRGRILEITELARAR